MDIKVLSYVIIPYILFGLIMIIAIALMWYKKFKQLPVGVDFKTTLSNLQKRNRISEHYAKTFGFWLLGMLLLFFNLSVSWAVEQEVAVINPITVTAMVFLIITFIGLIKK